jgi:hypothetical protein
MPRANHEWSSRALRCGIPDPGASRRGLATSYSFIHALEESLYPDQHGKARSLTMMLPKTYAPVQETASRSAHFDPIGRSRSLDAWTVDRSSTCLAAVGTRRGRRVQVLDRVESGWSRERTRLHPRSPLKFAAGNAASGAMLSRSNVKALRPTGSHGESRTPIPGTHAFAVGPGGPGRCKFGRESMAPNACNTKGRQVDRRLRGSISNKRSPCFTNLPSLKLTFLKCPRTRARTSTVWTAAIRPSQSLRSTTSRATG